METKEKKVALSFDAAWGNDDTQKILEILKKHGLHVTFFMTGGWVEKYPEDVKAIQAAGHDLGNHSENHKNMAQLSTEEQKTEIMTVHEKVKQLTGVDTVSYTHLDVYKRQAFTLVKFLAGMPLSENGVQSLE